MNRLVITDLRVAQFRKFANPVRLTGLGPGLNLLCAPNEAGKSSLKAALDAAFFIRHGGTGQAVEALRNQGNDASPVVQVAFDLGDESYCLTKRFHRQKRARLLRPDDSIAENEPAEEQLESLLGFERVRGRGPAAEVPGVWGLLWVAQGDSFTPAEVNASARGSLEECLAGGEVAAITGGARGHRVADLVRSELAKYMTEKTKKPTGRHAQLLQEQKDAEAELAAARAVKAELASQLHALEMSRRDRDAEVRGVDPVAEEKEIQALRQQLREAEQQAMQVDKAKLHLDLAERRLAQTQEAAERRDALVARVKTTAGACTKADADAKAQAETAKAAAARLAAAEQAFATADDAWKQAGRLVRTVVDRAKWQRLKQASGEKQTRLEQALAAARESGAAAKEAQALPATDAAVKKLRTLAGKREAAAAARTAAATVLHFSLTGEGAASLMLNGEVPPASGEAALTRPATLRLGALGQIEIRPGVQDAAAIDRALADAERAQAEALQALHCESLAEAEAQAERRRQLLQTENAAAEKARLYAPGLEGKAGGIADALEAVNAEAARAEEALAATTTPDVATPAGEALSEEDAEAALQQAEAARQDRNDARARERQAQALAEQSANQAAAALQAAKNSDAAAIEELEAARNVASDDALTEHITAARAALTAAKAHHAEVLQKSQDAGSPESIGNQIKRLERARDERGKRLAGLRENIASLEAQVRAKAERGPDEAIANAEERLSRLGWERERIERDVAALQLLDRTLREAQASAEAKYLAPVTQKLRPHLAALFGDARLNLAGDFSLQTLERMEQAEDIAQLSAGTQEQLAILSRLAFAEVLAEQGRPVVLLLDDALVYADDRRIQDMFGALERAAERFQVIVLSCRQRVFDGLGGEHQRRLSIEACEPIEI